MSNRATGRRVGTVALQAGCAVLVASGALLGGCTIGPSSAEGESSIARSATGTVSATDPSPSSGSGSPEAPNSSPSTGAVTGCVDRAIAAMDAGERLGQLFMVGLQPTQRADSLATALTRDRVGAVIYLGGWSGAARVQQTSSALQALAPGRAQLLIAADQEGGTVQQLRGPGFSRLPTALVQAQLPDTQLASMARNLAGELRAAGVNVNLAPVADTVPTSLGRANQPIGRWSRQYGSDPAVVGRAVSTMVSGLQDGRVIAAIKHFPGLGRVTGNTDFTANGVTDSTTTPTDAYLEPFRSGIRAGTGMVMMSSARYPLLDPSAPSTPAMFSRRIVTDLLRGSMDWDGVVITDDVGAAKAVAAVPVGDRAVRFLAAGGDIVLTAVPSQIPTMLAAVRARAAADPAFAAALQRSTQRVLTLKERFGLLDCS